MEHHQEQTLSIDDFFNHDHNQLIIFPSVEFLAKVKKDNIILSLLRIEDLKKRILASPNNRVLKLSLLLAERRLRGQQNHYQKFIQHFLEK
ncbi:MAG: hypothetical protein KJO77_05640 [Bacteroidia bacterium]|nr:hypothetical protein [Bacteroidia bacterium]NND51250.1 hypothetical protein [Flavobacteriaceae bacterium]